MARKKKQEERVRDKKVFYTLVLMFPSLLIAVSAEILGVYGLMIRVLLIAYQFILINNFMREFYGDY